MSHSFVKWEKSVGKKCQKGCKEQENWLTLQKRLCGKMFFFLINKIFSYRNIIINKKIMFENMLNRKFLVQENKKMLLVSPMHLFEEQCKKKKTLGNYFGKCSQGPEWTISKKRSFEGVNLYQKHKTSQKTKK